MNERITEKLDNERHQPRNKAENLARFPILGFVSVERQAPDFFAIPQLPLEVTIALGPSRPEA